MDIENESHRTSENEEKGERVAPVQRGTPVLRILIFVVMVGLIAVLIYRGITARAHATSELRKETDELAVPSVSVITPQREAGGIEAILPGSMQAYTDSPIYARTNGYLKRWTADIGTRVKSGQLLAEIDTPEIDHQFQQAQADLETAEANLKLSVSTAERWEFLLKTNSVSKQETDEKTGDLAAKKATVSAMKASLQRIGQLKSFQRIYAPFDGVITARNVDVGALIDAGSGAATARELFHIAAISRLRVYVSVPQDYSPAIRRGAQAQLTLAEFPGQHFQGRIVRTANAIDPSSRTLLTEVDVQNPTGQLLPGSFAQVHFRMPSKESALVVPVNTLMFRAEGLQIGVVRGGKAELVPVTLGADMGKEVQVVAGLKPDDQVIINPVDSLVSGTAVRVERAAAESKTKAGS